MTGYIENDDTPEFPDFSDCEDEGTFHAELRRIIEQAESLGNLGFGSDSPLAALVPHAKALLALPEESVAALVAAAQSMTEAASFGR